MVLLLKRRRLAPAVAALGESAAAEGVIIAAKLVIWLRIAVTTVVSVEEERLVTVVVSLVTWLGIAFRNQAAVNVAAGATLAVKLVILLGIAFRKEAAAVNVEAVAAVVLVTRVVESVTWRGTVRRRDSLVHVTSVVVLVTWRVIVTREEAVEVVESATSVVKEVILQGNVLLLDLLPNQQKD